MNSAPLGVPCTQHSDAPIPLKTAICPTARLNDWELAPHGGGRTTTVPVFNSDPAVALTLVVLSEAWAVRIAPLPKLSAVTIVVSADSTVVACTTVFPYWSAARAFNRNESPTPSSWTVSRERII